MADASVKITIRRNNVVFKEIKQSINPNSFTDSVNVLKFVQKEANAALTSLVEMENSGDSIGEECAESEDDEEDEVPTTPKRKHGSGDEDQIKKPKGN